MEFKNYKQSFNLLTVVNLSSQNSIDCLNNSDTAVVEEIDLDKEWEGILGNESEQVSLAGEFGF